MDRNISSAPIYRRLAAGTYNQAALAAIMPSEGEALCTGLELVDGGTCTVTRPDGTVENLGTLPAGWVRAIQFIAVTSASSMIVYRSTGQGAI